MDDLSSLLSDLAVEIESQSHFYDYVTIGEEKARAPRPSDPAILFNKLEELMHAAGHESAAFRLNHWSIHPDLQRRDDVVEFIERCNDDLDDLPDKHNDLVRVSDGEPTNYKRFKKYDYSSHQFEAIVGCPSNKIVVWECIRCGKTIRKNNASNI
jgi:hypothetical protein